MGAAARRRPAGRRSIFNLTQSSGYLSVDNFVNLFQLHIEKVIVVVTMTFVIIAGEIDLSVASVMAWSAAVLASLHEHDVPFALAIVVALAAAGARRPRPRLPHRQGRSAVARRHARRAHRLARRGQGARRGPVDRGLPELVRPARPGRPRRARCRSPSSSSSACSPSAGSCSAAPPPAVSCTSSATTPRSPATRRSTSSRPGSGCSSRRRSTAGLAGILFAARLGTVRGDLATGFELEIITIVLLGGVSIFGGSGTMSGVALAVLIVLEPAQRVRPGQRRRQHPDRRDRGDPHRLRARPQRASTVSSTGARPDARAPAGTATAPSPAPSARDATHRTTNTNTNKGEPT